MTTGAAVEPLPERAAPAAVTGKRPGGGRRWLSVGLFLGPAAILLGFIVGYPMVATIVRSMFDNSGDFGSRFVGVDNYRTIFGSAETLVAIRNNAIWVVVAPFLITFLGLIFAVLTERVRWATAFKTIVFMPMVISLFAAGLIWRIVYETDPNRGVVNSAIGTVADLFNPPGEYTGANVAAASGLRTDASGNFESSATASPGGTLKLGFTGIPPDAVPPGARPASPPSGQGGAVTGIVWRDFSAGGKVGQVDPGELGLPGMRLHLLRADGSSAGTATTDSGGTFRFDGVSSGSYRVAIDPSNFQAGFTGVNWLGPQSVTPTSHLSSIGRSVLSVPLVTLAEIVAMLWIWAGFAMVVIGAGLAALNREVLEAARIDGATEWQTFRRVTLPLLRPVLVVVFITMIINILKIFDIVLAIAPDSSKQESTVIAVKMWDLFTGNELGLSSALAVFLFVLVVPVMWFNVRRIRE